MHIVDSPSAAYEGPLSTKLEPYITEAQLDQNFAEHPLMQREYTDRERAEIGAVAAHLALVPLVHTFRDSENIANMRTQGLLPQVMRQQGGTTFALDSSLGLDEYSFMHWGQMGSHTYGNEHITVDGSVLLSDNTLVTASDISAHSGERDNLLKSFQDLPNSTQQGLHTSNFSRAYRGKDWLELTARGVYNYLKHRPNNLYPLSSEMDMGEVKYHGTTPANALGDVVSDDSRLEAISKTDFEDRLIDLGIAPFGVSHILYPSTYSAYTEAETLDVQRRTAHAHGIWQRVLSEA
jgi:hypothetical protein